MLEQLSRLADPGAFRANYYTRTMPSIKMPAPLFNYTFGAATNKYNTQGSGGSPSVITDTTYIRAGVSSLKLLKTTTGVTAFGVQQGFNGETLTNAWTNPVSVTLAGKAMRLRYFIHYEDSSLMDFTVPQVFIRFYSDSSSNSATVYLPGAPGWNTVEFTLGNVSTVAGNLSLEALSAEAFEGYMLYFGYGNVIHQNDYIIFDQLEIWDTGQTTAWVCVQLDDGLSEQVEMAAYCAAKGVPVMIYVSPEKVGRTGYLTWDEIYLLSRNQNVLIGTHCDTAVPAGLSADALEDWCVNQKSPLIERGILRGAEFFALPGGQTLSLHSPDDLRILQKYFVHIRGTGCFYQHSDVTGGYTGQAPNNGNYPLVPREYAWGTAAQIVTAEASESYWSTLLARAIDRKSFLSLYAHGLTEVTASWVTSRAGFRACIDAIVAARDASPATLKVCTYEDVINGKVP
jgi:hypothetical protein